MRFESEFALYPETTTFYRADVKGMLDDGAKVQLLFEEENAGALKIVDRRFVRTTEARPAVINPPL
jgi:hypothetical protein